jgi:hypothetical protein
MCSRQNLLLLLKYINAELALLTYPLTKIMKKMDLKKKKVFKSRIDPVGYFSHLLTFLFSAESYPPLSFNYLQ